MRNDLIGLARQSIDGPSQYVWRLMGGLTAIQRPSDLYELPTIQCLFQGPLPDLSSSSRVLAALKSRAGQTGLPGSKNTKLTLVDLNRSAATEQASFCVMSGQGSGDEAQEVVGRRKRSMIGGGQRGRTRSMQQQERRHKARDGNVSTPLPPLGT